MTATDTWLRRRSGRHGAGRYAEGGEEGMSKAQCTVETFGDFVVRSMCLDDWSQNSYNLDFKYINSFIMG